MFPFCLVILAALQGALASCVDYYASLKATPAKQWCSEGKYFNYTSNRNNLTSQVFYRCSGKPTNPAIVMGHGWPTSSFDFQRLASVLHKEYYVCALDYVGHGFSDKPVDAAYRYSLFEHASIVEHLVTNVVSIKSFTYLAHDEGDSVALVFLSRYEQNKQEKPFVLERLVILNGGIYLPLQHLTRGQKRLLSNTTGPILEKFINGHSIAKGLGAKLYKPELTSNEISDLASIFDYQKGCHVFHGTIQYLNERWKFEDTWLAMLGQSSVPTTMIWGTADPVSVIKEGQYVWDNFLMNRTTAPATLHMIDGASHYVHVDHAEEVANIIRNAIDHRTAISV